MRPLPIPSTEYICIRSRTTHKGPSRHRKPNESVAIILNCFPPRFPVVLFIDDSKYLVEHEHGKHTSLRLTSRRSPRQRTSLPSGLTCKLTLQLCSRKSHVILLRVFFRGYFRAYCYLLSTNYSVGVATEIKPRMKIIH